VGDKVTDIKDGVARYATPSFFNGQGSGPGFGISPADLEHTCDPFFLTKIQLEVASKGTIFRSLLRSA